MLKPLRRCTNKHRNCQQRCLVRIELPSYVLRFVFTMTCVDARDSPPREEGWSLTALASECVFEMACDRPPRLRGIRWLRDFVIDRAATPSSRGGELRHRVNPDCCLKNAVSLSFRFEKACSVSPFPLSRFS